MAIPFRLPTYHDPRAHLVARAGQLLHDLLDTLGQLEQLQQTPVPPPSDEWLLEDESSESAADQPQQLSVSVQLLVDALGLAGHQTLPDTFDRVVGDQSNAGSALASLVSCQHDPRNATPAAAAAARTASAPAPMSMPQRSSCASQSARSAQSWNEVGNHLKRLADQLSQNNRLKKTCFTTDSSPSESEGSVTKGSGGNLGLIQSLMALVLPKKLSYSATFLYLGMRLLRCNLKQGDF